jgi:hypothetical protein
MRFVIGIFQGKVFYLLLLKNVYQAYSFQRRQLPGFVSGASLYG